MKERVIDWAVTISLAALVYLMCDTWWETKKTRHFIEQITEHIKETP